MESIFRWIVKHKGIILAVYAVAFVACFFCWQLVGVNYTLTDYLPEDAPSSTALNVMEEEFGGGIPNARVMVPNLTVSEALAIKGRLAAVDGVSEVTWLDDVVSVEIPLEVIGTDVTEEYYKDNVALFSLTIDDDALAPATEAVREIIGEEGSMAGAAVDSAVAITNTESEVRGIIMIAVPFCFLVLIFTTSSWLEPLLIMGGIGFAIVLNSGTNLMFGEISFVTNAAGSILQLAVSLDYSIFLLHRYEEFLRKGRTPEEAMLEALTRSAASITSSGVTTVIGFAALILMRFRIGPDMGMALAKGICISLITVFTLLPSLTLVCQRPLEKLHHRPLLPEFDKFANLVTKVMVPLVLVFAVAIVPAYLGQSHNSFYFGASRFFGPNTQAGQERQLVEDEFGKSTPVVMLVPRGDFSTEEAIISEIKKIPQVGTVISYSETVGAAIPPEYLDKAISSQLLSENYSRMVVSLKADTEGEAVFALVEELREIGERHSPGQYYLAGESVSTYDLKTVITEDNTRVNLIAVGAVFVVLAISFKSLSLPFILVLSIETAVWINQSVPYFMDTTLFYIGYLIIGSVQLGATVDYAILLTTRYLEHREKNPKLLAIKKAVANSAVSVLTSGTALTVVGFLLGYMSSHGLLSQLGTLLGRGTLLSMAIVFFVLPGLLVSFDRIIEKTTRNVKFYHEETETELQHAEEIKESEAI